MLSSGCTGWDPNVAEMAVADSIMGTWKTIGDPCTGPDADKTFYAQSTYVQPVVGKKDAYIALFDRWEKERFGRLPLCMVAYIDKRRKNYYPLAGEMESFLFR